jgi:hypothetical protein
MKKKVRDELLQANLGMYSDQTKIDQMEKMAHQLKKKEKR